MKSRKSSCDPELNRYTGRFAPSPSGPLHFGSLLTAVASYLDARSQQGRWLVRIEDLDPHREPPGTDQIILQQLQDYGLEWDGEVIYQSTRLAEYKAVLQKLLDQQLAYHCNCSRQRIRASGAVYDGHCRSHAPPAGAPSAIRVRTDNRCIHFDDRVQGPQSESVEKQTGDFVVWRREGLVAYQLAVVVDDAWQQVTHVVRGWDLLESTARQIYLQQLLGYPTPSYAHIPVVSNALGQKLSKQQYAEPLPVPARRDLMHRCLGFLGLQPDSGNQFLPLREQLEWAASHWHIQSVPKLANIPETAFIPG